ncbi:ORMDL family-domain-containing protein [Ustulina deusta]|nr:ORMDL family-domain-containing protein [Ustulina deusta]
MADQLQKHPCADGVAGERLWAAESASCVALRRLGNRPKDSSLSNQAATSTNLSSNKHITGATITHCALRRSRANSPFSRVQPVDGFRDVADHKTTAGQPGPPPVLSSSESLPRPWLRLWLRLRLSGHETQHRDTATPRYHSACPSSRPTFCASPSPAPINTAKLSSPILIPRTVSYDVGTNPPRRGTAYQNLNMGDQKTGRRRRSSSILQIYQEPLEPIEQLSDQSALPNLNANWVNAKGAWTIHIVLIVALKILWDVIPGVSQETSWTLTNISYMFGSYIMFHWVRGVPFDFNSGAYDNLNMWEQIDDGAQYTPAKKFLLSVPIVLFLLSTHYTHYDLAYFTINFLAVLGVVIPKLPFVRPPLPSASLVNIQYPLVRPSNELIESPHESWSIFGCA